MAGAQRQSALLAMAGQLGLGCRERAGRGRARQGNLGVGGQDEWKSLCGGGFTVSWAVIPGALEDAMFFSRGEWHVRKAWGVRRFAVFRRQELRGSGCGKFELKLYQMWSVTTERP
jgi:hypothetical protein